MKATSTKAAERIGHMEKEKNTGKQVVKVFLGFAELMFVILRIFIEIIKAAILKFMPVAEKSVTGEIVLITGAGHGIGRELALQYAALGTTVVGWDLNQTGNEQTMNDIAKMGATKAFAYQCDVSNRQQVLEVAKKVQEEVGNVTILVNNAGIMPCHTLAEHTEQEIRKIFDINVMAHFWMLEAFLPSMREKNHGHVVAMSSIAGLCGLRNLVPYCASKYAVRGMMESIHEEMRETIPDNQVEFTTICPYMVDTGLCKNPKIKFPGVMSLLSPKVVAEAIINAQRKNMKEVTIPNYMLTMNYMFRLLPIKCSLIFKDYVNSYVDSDRI